MGSNRTAPASGSVPGSGDSASPGTDLATGSAFHHLPASSPSSSSPSSILSTTAAVVVTTTTTSLSRTLMTNSIGGGGVGGGAAGRGSKSSGGDASTDDVLPWILCFGIGLILIWIGWMLRQYINRRCCGGQQQRIESHRNVHWQWISTGNPNSGSLLPRQKQAHNDAKVDLTEVDPGRFEILIGGDMTPGSGMTPIASQVMISPEQQGSLSKNDFNHLLGRVCSITDPAVKMQTFELTFENIQLGAWTPDEWHKFTHKLFAFHPKVNAILEMKNGYVNKRSVLDEWLNWQTVEKAKMSDIYEALVAADKVDVAHNAAISVTLELRQAAGRITSECVDVLSECSDQPNNEELEILEEEDEDEDEEEEDLTPTNSVKAAFSPNLGGGGSGSHYRNNSQRQRTRSNHDRDNNFGGNQQQQQQQQHRRSTGSSSTAERERVISTSSSIGVGVEERLGQRPEDSLLANATVNDGTLTTPTAGAGPAPISHPGSPSSSSSPSSPRSHENSLHLNNHHHHHHQHPHHPSPARLPSLNDSDAGNHDTIHSTEKLIHV